MELLVDLTKEEVLGAMYASVERMNAAILDEAPRDYRAERKLQQSLRKYFEELLKNEQDCS